VHTYPFADLALARRLERAEATSNARFVELRAGLDPGRGACWIEVGGTYAMYDGPASPVTQTFGLGMFQAPTERGYRPFEFTSVMFRPVTSPPVPESPSPRPGVIVRVIGADEADLWAKTASTGWGAADGDFMLDVARVNAVAPDGHLFLAELDGRPIATAALAIHDGVAHFAGASTIPAGRRNGAQLALLDARMRHAAAHGCDLALMGAAPGSGSQRNAERHGFRIAYSGSPIRASNGVSPGKLKVKS